MRREPLELVDGMWEPMDQIPSNEQSMLLVGNFLSNFGMSRQVCEELAGALREAGWRVITTSDRKQRVARLCDMVATAWGRRHEYAVAQVDVFSGAGFFWAESVCWALQRARKPYVLTLHGGALPTFAAGWPKRARRLLQSAAAVTAPSRYLSERMSPYRSSIRIIPNAVDLQRYRFQARASPEPRLVWLRAFHSVYAPEIAPVVVSLLLKEFPGIQLTMVGPDKGDGSLAKTRAIAAELGVLDRITWPGAVPKADVPEWLQQGDIFLNTTTVDNAPVSVLEAMASGLCVVSTNVGGVPYLVADGNDGLLVPPNDANAMAAAVRRVLTNPGFASRLSVAARTTAEASDWAAVLPQWNELLRSVSGKGSS